MFVALLAIPGCHGGAELPPDRVVLVTIDTLRADHVGSYGAARAHTPHLDTVAAEGVRFEVAVSPAPLTLPSHASLMTALDPPDHGVRHNAIHRLGDGIPTLAEHLRAASYATAAFVGSLVLDGRFGLTRGFDVYDDAMAGRVSAKVGFAERPADRVVDAALAWLDGAPDRFFLWVHFYDPHATYKPPPGFASAFASRPYAGEIAFTDAHLGRLVGELRERWPEGGTLLVVTSDHGESLGEHGEASHSYSIYDATQLVPLLMSGPGVPRGRAVASPVRLVDVAPTLLALAGADPLPDVAGRDLRPLIDGSEAGERVAYLETLATRLDYGWSPLLGLRTARFKYIRAPRPELYDLRGDPAERRDLAAAKPEVVARLDRLLSQRLGAAAAPRADARLAVGLGEADRARLRSLGYVAPARAAAAAPSDAVGGPDPKDEIGVLQVLREAQKDTDAGRLGAALERLAGVENGGTAAPAMRAAIAVATGDYALAERDARSVLGRQPDRPDILIILGRALAGQGRLAEARAAFEAAALLDPGSSTAHTYLGRVYEGLDRPDAAADAYARARRANPAASEPTWRLAVLLLKRGSVALADAVLAALPPERPLSPAAVVSLAQAEANAGRREAAGRRLAQALARDPGDPRLVRASDALRGASREPRPSP
jgi:arylsulfatase A-like enzyme/Tfp pilus assembly protein PilF